MLFFLADESFSKEISGLRQTTLGVSRSVAKVIAFNNDMVEEATIIVQRVQFVMTTVFQIVPLQSIHLWPQLAGAYLLQLRDDLSQQYQDSSKPLLAVYHVEPLQSS